MKKFLKDNWLPLLILVVWTLFAICLYMEYHTINGKVEEIEYTDTNGAYHKLFYETEFNSLKKENKALYDSLKQYKEQITYLIQFKDKREYSTGHVDIHEDTTNASTTFEYVNEPNDTMRYKLKINADKEPYWYSLDITTNTEYTIVNKTYDDGLNHTTVEGGGEISDITIFKKKEKTKFMDRFSFGPMVGVGYDPVNKNISPMIGIGITFDLRKK